MTFTKQVHTKYLVLSEKTLTLWHGGNLEVSSDFVAHKKGRWEFGPALYLTTHYDTARKYSKGSRKLYQVVIREGTNIKDVHLSFLLCKDFIETYVIRKKQKDILSRLEKWKKDDQKVSADIFLNILINEDAVKSTYTDQLRKFLVQNGIDYSIVDNAFGWHERMVALFNMGLIVSKKIIKPSDKIEVFDLPTDFQ